MDKNDYTNNIDLSAEGLCGQQPRRPSIAQAALLYSVAVVLLLYVGFKAQNASRYPGLLITEFLLILAPSLALLLIGRYDFKSVLRIKGVSLINLFIILCIMGAALPIVGFLNMLNLFVIETVFGRVVLPDIPVASNGTELLVNILIIGGSAGICEEIMFRGVIQRGMERLGAVKSILITAFLFGLMHLDFQRFLGTFVLGALIGFIVYRTNSIFAGIFAHFVNNSIAVVASYAAARIGELAKSMGKDQLTAETGKYLSSLTSLPFEQLIGVIIVWGFMFMSCAAVLTGLIVALIRTTEQEVRPVVKESSTRGRAGLLWALPGILITAAIYFAQGLKLSDPSNALADRILSILRL
ncbi:hypothetical protein DFR58_11250 [Anaerobacterium chartisolvens]|uniref:CAAX prenyl protease 2/Lysostaphin resistance protein A-like domain-containing protein n=1 Tax=Anaerobacterium chartisolvens TaxID=1297424 RepID=A0A369B621_9FIRM|nr:type II CAAX endopeptidase family protein [Anaerobacterium chartisolvens]RCX16068.1 hypothetical protein DFR58_11250 [Anaerobacterium chartisolvens]